MEPLLDPKDLQLLAILQEDGRLKRNELAERVGLSLPAVSERMRKLEARGIIRGYHAVVSHEALGYDLTAFIRVSLDGSSHYHDFVTRAVELPEVQECHSITGDGSHLLKIRTVNTASLERLLSTLQGWPGVKNTDTSIVLSSFKETRFIPGAADRRRVKEKTSA